MIDIFRRYGDLLAEVDEWFTACASIHADIIACGKGCSGCCRGLFDITMLDALYLRSGFEKLSYDIRYDLNSRALKRLEDLTAGFPAFTSPWLLTDFPETDWADLMPEDDETPCLLLTAEGSCLLYEYRPMTCRLNGIPLIDFSGEEFSDEWCTINFKVTNPHSLADIRYCFRDLFTREQHLFRELTCKMFDTPLNEIDTIIPAVLLKKPEFINNINLKQNFI